MPQLRPSQAAIENFNAILKQSQEAELIAHQQKLGIEEVKETAEVTQKEKVEEKDKPLTFSCREKMEYVSGRLANLSIQLKSIDEPVHIKILDDALSTWSKRT